MNSKPVTPKHRIFIVDDHPLVREGLTNLINGQDDLMVCGEAEDSTEAIAGIARTQPDIALIDISLKNDSGLELVKNLENQSPPVGLIEARDDEKRAYRHPPRA